MSGAVAGAEVGGEIGALGGPVGAAAGAVVGGLIGLGLGIWAVHAINHANQKADEGLSDKAKAEPCAECGEVGCFTTKKGGDPEEMARQLKEQQDAINKMSPDELLKNMDKYDMDKRPKDAPARAQARDEAAAAARNSATEQALQEGKSSGDAAKAGDAAASEATADKDVLHTPDFNAGGTGKMSGLGDRSTNRSIGSQWIRKSPGSSSTRREALRKAAEAAKKAGKKLDIKLETCDEATS